jgi:nucleolar protein 56
MAGKAVFKHILGGSFSEEDIPEVLKKFKEPKYFSQFYEKNLEIAKKNLKKAFGKDVLVVQVSNHMAELERVINTLAKRLREWYELYNPEFSKSLSSHKKFAELVREKSKNALLKELNLKESMGVDLPQKDVDAMLRLAELITDVYKEKEDQEKYLEKLMKEVCPNITSVAGVAVGSKLLSLAGSLEKLSRMTASTVQLLGAEKALFRHLKKKTLPPKYGIIHEHPLIQGSPKSKHGKVARVLADKISIAAKVDYFKGEFVGDKLKKDVERRLKK